MYCRTLEDEKGKIKKNKWMRKNGVKTESRRVCSTAERGEGIAGGGRWKWNYGVYTKKSSSLAFLPFPYLDSESVPVRILDAQEQNRKAGVVRFHLESTGRKQKKEFVR
jgi:hypothetical protein